MWGSTGLEMPIHTHFVSAAIWTISTYKVGQTYCQNSPMGYIFVDRSSFSEVNYGKKVSKKTTQMAPKAAVLC